MSTNSKMPSSWMAALSQVFATIAMVPYQYRATPANAQVDGIGRVFTVTCAQGSTTTITHLLGRVPVMAQLIDNGTAAQTLLQVTARSSTTITIKPLTASLANALVRVV